MEVLLSNLQQRRVAINPPVTKLREYGNESPLLLKPWKILVTSIYGMDQRLDSRTSSCYLLAACISRSEIAPITEQLTRCLS